MKTEQRTPAALVVLTSFYEARHEARLNWIKGKIEEKEREKWERRVRETEDLLL